RLEARMHEREWPVSAKSKMLWSASLMRAKSMNVRVAARFQASTSQRGILAKRDLPDSRQETVAQPLQQPARGHDIARGPNREHRRSIDLCHLNRVATGGPIARPLRRP